MKIYDASGFNSSLTGSFSGSFKGTVGSHLLPESNITLDLGSDTQRWRDLYLSGSTIYLGTSIISATPEGGITFKDKNTLALRNLETTSSYALFAISASEAAHSKTADSATTAITASYSLNAGENQGFPFSGSADVTGSLFVSGGNISGSFVGDFAGDGSGLTNLQLSQATAVTDEFINATFKRVQHNFNSKNVIVAVFNENDEVIFPDSIKTVDANNVDVTFHSARTGRVVVNRGGHIVSGSINITENTAYEDVFDNVTTKTVVHNFNTKNVFVSTFNEAGYLMFPENTRIINENIVQLDFISPTSGRVVVGKGGHLISGSLVTETTTVTDTFTSVPYTIISHNFNTKDVIVSVYLDDDTLFFPDVIKTLDVNTVRVDFDQERSGRVVVAKGGHLISGSISVVEATLFEDTFTNEQEILPVHSFGTKNVNVVVYDNLDEQLIPSSVNTITDNQVRIRFEKPRSGRVVITKGGHLVSGSYAVDYKNILNKPNLVSGSLDYSGILNKPDLVSGSGQISDLSIYSMVGLEDMYYAQLISLKATT